MFILRKIEPGKGCASFRVHAVAFSHKDGAMRVQTDKITSRKVKTMSVFEARQHWKKLMADGFNRISKETHEEWIEFAEFKREDWASD